jgi:hypothetical protein
MPKTQIKDLTPHGSRVLDARPERVDYRDPRLNATYMWDPETVQDVEAWQRLVAGKLKAIRYDKSHRVNDVAMIPLAHGPFDNDLDVVTATLERVLRKQPLPTKVEILHGF